MANTIPGPNMGLTIPVPTQQIGPDWATNISSDLQIIDGHNHNVVGAKVPTGGINIDADLSMNNNALTSSTKLGMNDIQTTLGSTEKGYLYRVGEDLYYNNGNGDTVHITSGTTVNAGAGTIDGLPSGTASAKYLAGNFTFNASTTQKATVDCAGLLLETSGSTNQLSVLPPATLSGGSYTLTLPAVPATQSFITVNATGDMAAPTPYPLTASGIANNTITASQIANNTITATQIANNTITATQIAPNTITYNEIANNTITANQISNTASIFRSQLSTPDILYTSSSAINVSTASSSYVTVASGTMATAPRNYSFQLGSWTSTSGYFYLTSSGSYTNYTGQVKLLIDGVNIYETIIPLTLLSSGTVYFPLNINVSRTCTYATHTWALQLATSSGFTFGITQGNVTILGY